MATANDIISRAFARAGIRASESALEDTEILDGLDLLNDMLSNWEPSLSLGFSPVENITDEIRIPRYANMAVIDSLAIILAPEYSKMISPSLAASARLSYDNMIKARIDLSNIEMPSTLPLGSGNECDNGDETRFFRQKDKVNF